MTWHSIGSQLLRLVFGVLLGALCLGAGLLVVGMGHGWELPFRYGALSLLLYPLAMAALGLGSRAGAGWMGGVLLALALSLDAAALHDALASPEVRVAGGLLAPWVVLWLGWQGAAGAALWRGLRARISPRARLLVGLGGLAAVVVAIAAALGLLERRSPSASDVAIAVQRSIDVEFVMVRLGQGPDLSDLVALVGPEGSRVSVSDVACTQGGDAWTCSFTFETHSATGEVVVPTRPMRQELWRPSGFWEVRDPQSAHSEAQRHLSSVTSNWGVARRCPCRDRPQPPSGAAAAQ